MIAEYFTEIYKRPDHMKPQNDDEEMKNQDAVVKDFKTSKEQKIKQNLLIHYLQGKL